MHRTDGEGADGLAPRPVAQYERRGVATNATNAAASSLADGGAADSSQRACAATATAAASTPSFEFSGVRAGAGAAARDGDDEYGSRSGGGDGNSCVGTGGSGGTGCEGGKALPAQKQKNSKNSQRYKWQKELTHEEALQGSVWTAPLQGQEVGDVLIAVGGVNGGVEGPAGLCVCFRLFR